MSWESIISLFVGIAGGALVSWKITALFYQRSSRDQEAMQRLLSAEGQQRQRSINAIGLMLERQGAAAAWDDRGNLVTLHFGSAHLDGAGSLQARATAGPPPVYDRQHEQPEAPNSPGA